MTPVLTTASQKILAHANDWITEYHRDPNGGMAASLKTSRYGQLSLEIFRGLSRALRLGDASALARYRDATSYPDMACGYMAKHTKTTTHMENELLSVFRELLRDGHLVGLETLKKSIKSWDEVLYTTHLKPTNMDLAIVAATTRKGWEWWKSTKPLAFPYEEKNWPKVIENTLEQVNNDEGRMSAALSRLKRLKTVYAESDSDQRDRWAAALGTRLPMTASQGRQLLELAGVDQNPVPLIQELLRRSLRTSRFLRSEPPVLLFGSESYAFLARVALETVKFDRCVEWPGLGVGEKVPTVWLQDTLNTDPVEFARRLELLASDGQGAKTLRTDQAVVAIERVLDFVAHVSLTQKHANHAKPSCDRATPAL